MEYSVIITEKYINDNIRPYTAEPSIFYGAVREALMLYLKGKIGETYYRELINDTPSDELKLFLDGGLRDVLAYYVLSVTIRTVSATVTRYGYTQKENSDGLSTQAYNSKIVADANYFKGVADSMLADILPTMQLEKSNTNIGFRIRVIGE